MPGMGPSRDRRQFRKSCSSAISSSSIVMVRLDNQAEKGTSICSFSVPPPGNPLDRRRMYNVGYHSALDRWRGSALHRGTNPSLRRKALAAAQPEWGGRFAFLDALSDVGNELLEDLEREVVDPHRSLWHVNGQQHTAFELLQKDAQLYEGISSLLSAIQRSANKPPNKGAGCVDAVSDGKQELLNAIRDTMAASHLKFLFRNSEESIDTTALQEKARKLEPVWSAVSSLESWTEKHFIVDDWFKEAALHTVYSLSANVPDVRDGVPRPRWQFTPKPLTLEKFSFQHGPWIPHAPYRMKRSEYRKQVSTLFRSCLRAYLDRQERAWSSGKDSLATHALWTAQRFLGLGFMEVWRQTDPVLRPFDSETIKKTVKRFALDIDLTMPKKVPGRPTAGQISRGR